MGGLLGENIYLYQFTALNAYWVTAQEAYSECNAPQRDDLALPGTFGVGSEKRCQSIRG
jgi:hypothetical protein